MPVEAKERDKSESLIVELVLSLPGSKDTTKLMFTQTAMVKVMVHKRKPTNSYKCEQELCKEKDMLMEVIGRSGLKVVHMDKHYIILQNKLNLKIIKLS